MIPAKRWMVVSGLIAVCSGSVSADVTITQTFSVEGQAAAALGNVQMPRVVMRIKGMKSRTDVDAMGQTFAAIMDVTAGQMIVLRSETKTATIMTPASAIPAGAAPAVSDMTLTVTPTGQSRTIEGMACEEQTLTLSFNLADLRTAHVPPETAAMMKDVRIVANGSMWFAPSAPGVADFTAFQKAAASSKLLSPLAAMAPSPSGGMDRLWEAFQSVPGLPCLSEMSMIVEGSGPLAEIAKQQGTVKITQRTTAVSTDPLADEIFAVPPDYRIEKK